jgi:hypothetical protein
MMSVPIVQEAAVLWPVFSEGSVMKAFLSFATVSVALLLLTSCASTGTAYEKAPVQNDEVMTDMVYIAAVENLAKHHGTEVMWVNPPKKRIVGPVASTQ